MSTQQLLHEVNVRLLLRRLSERHGRRITLGAVAAEEWREITRGADLVWLMGAWRRSHEARAQALAPGGLRAAYDAALPGWTEGDVDGSPYAVQSYVLDGALGDAQDLPRLRSALDRAGLGLVLDFVPNHLARDHAWTESHPARFVPGDPEAAATHPEWFFRTRRGVLLAHGKDPHFPPWTDTAQVNFHSAEMRHALVRELHAIAEIADGVRCDMAMLALNETFERVWGWALPDEPRPRAEFWAEAIDSVKARRPGFLFIAEAYWGLERRLTDLGFDYVYDKALYDLLRAGGAPAVRRHITEGRGWHRHAVHFIENHDEERALAAFGPARVRAAAVVITTLPGLCLLHDGQLEGRRVRLPVQLVREPAEAVDVGMERFYSRLLAIPRVHAAARWDLLVPTEASVSDRSHENLLAWSWSGPAGLRIVTVNYSSAPARARVPLALSPGVQQEIRLYDRLADIVYVRRAAELISPGLYVALEPWACHVLDTTDV